MISFTRIEDIGIHSSLTILPSAVYHFLDTFYTVLVQYFYMCLIFTHFCLQLGACTPTPRPRGKPIPRVKLVASVGGFFTRFFTLIFTLFLSVAPEKMI